MKQKENKQNTLKQDNVKKGLTFVLMMLVLGIGLFAGTRSRLGHFAGGVLAKFKPDLQVVKIDTLRDCRLAITVRNNGPGMLPESVYSVHHPKSAGVYVYINGKSYGGQTIWYFDKAKNLKKKGGMARCVLNYKVGSPITVKAVVDLHNVVKETNECNNTMYRRKLGCGSSGLTVGPVIGTPGISICYKNSISNIRFSPTSAAKLNLNQRVKVTFDYSTNEKKGVYIFARPMTRGSLSPNYAAHPSKLYPYGKGKGDGFFTITKGMVLVNAVRFRMMNKAQTKVLFEKIVRVRYQFGKLLLTPPQRFFLDFHDAYLVYVPSSKVLQITAQMNVLSYGQDWQRVQLKPYLYHLRQKNWKGFYWQVNTVRKKVFRVTGCTFGSIGGTRQPIHGITVQTVGGSNKKAPRRFMLRFKKAYLVYVPASKILQVVTCKTVLSYGSDWQKCNKRANIYHLKQNVWKGFFWSINTLAKKAYKVSGGSFCGNGGTSSPLSVGVRVIK